MFLEVGGVGRLGFWRQAYVDGCDETTVDKQCNSEIVYQEPRILLYIYIYIYIYNVVW
jgi:hypothetical protein